MFFRKKQKATSPTPSWLKWIVLAIVAYAILAPHPHRTNPDGTPVPSPIEELKKNFNAPPYQGNLLPTFSRDLQIKDIAAGSGEPAVCGQEVKIAYESFSEDGKPLDDHASKDKPLAFRIGSGETLPAFDQGIVGMKQGGKRSLLAPPAMAQPNGAAALQAPLRFDVTLLAITPPLPDRSSTLYRIIDVYDGAGRIVACGNPVKLRLAVWNMEGKKLFAPEEPITFTPGKSEIFLGLEQGVVGMHENHSMRTLIVPPSFQKTMNGNAPSVKIPLPTHETVLVDVETVP